MFSLFTIHYFLGPRAHYSGALCALSRLHLQCSGQYIFCLNFQKLYRATPMFLLFAALEAFLFEVIKMEDRTEQPKERNTLRGGRR